MNVHEIDLRKTAKQMGVNKGGEMHEYKGCLMAKGFRVSIPKKTENPSVKRLRRVFVDFGERGVWVYWAKQVPDYCEDDSSRYA